MGVKILFVDDEPDQAKLVQRMFRRKIRAGELFFQFAGDGEEAISVLESEPDVDIVVTDINMPRMDGLTLLDRLADRDLKSLVVSAYGDMENIRTAMNRGAFDFVTKPVDFDDLEATIQKSVIALEELRDTRRQLEEAERVRTNLARFFSPNLAFQLVNDPEDLEVGGERRELTFVFTDLSDFTSLVERSEPKLIVSLLNEYLDEMTNIVFDHGGTIDKVVGDAVHAMFGAPMAQPDHARRAVKCALDLDEYACGFQAQKNAVGVALGHTRIGINTGPVIVGNFGGETFFDYTAHGDAINTTARLEAANKRLGTRICVSANTVAKIDGFEGRRVGSVLLKGKSGTLDVYEPLNAASGRAFGADYAAAVDFAGSGDPRAMEAFEALAVSYPDDPVVAGYVARLGRGETGTEFDLR